MKVSIFCVITFLATSTSTANVPDHIGKGAPVFAFQQSLENPPRDDRHGDAERSTEESSSVIKDVQGREEEDNGYASRFKWETEPSEDQERGRFEDNIDRKNDQGTRVDVIVYGRAWDSGRGLVDVNGNYGTYRGPGENGKPNHRGDISYSQRFRRDAQGDDENKRVKVHVDVRGDNQHGYDVNTRATGKIWQSEDGNDALEVQGNYRRHYGGPDGTSSPSYGGKLTFEHKFKREATGSEFRGGLIELNEEREVEDNADHSGWAKREANPGHSQVRGPVEVDVNGDRSGRESSRDGDRGRIDVEVN